MACVWDYPNGDTNGNSQDIKEERFTVYTGVTKLRIFALYVINARAKLPAIQTRQVFKC